MDERQLESQSRLLIELGEPETWLETMLRASRRSASHEDRNGNEELAGRWRRLAKGLEHVIAATVNDPVADGETAPTNMARQHLNPTIAEPMDTGPQAQAEPQQHASQDDDAA